MLLYYLKHLKEIQPDIVHIISHGDEEAGLEIGNKKQEIEHYSLEELQKAFEVYQKRTGKTLELLVCNACNTHELCKKIVDTGYIKRAIGVEGPVEDKKDALYFTETFYEQFNKEENDLESIDSCLTDINDELSVTANHNYTTDKIYHLYIQGDPK
ncbi:MAG: hypothetical protein AAF518_22345 [Spirochaetota bacterium]